MKHFKTMYYMLFIAVIMVSCEKETTTLPENSKLNEQEKDILEFKSVSEMVDAGFDFNAHRAILPTQKSSNDQLNSKIIDEESGLIFYTDREEFLNDGCDNLTLENFEPTNPFGINTISNPLNENTDNDLYSPGEIQSGISIYTDVNRENSLYIPSINSTFKIVANYYVDYLNIDISLPYIYTVSMNLSLWSGSGNIDIQIFGNSGLIGSFTISAPYTHFGEEAFFGVQSIEPITKITLNSQTGDAEVLDNLSFGTCNNTDFDRDGCLNEEDPSPHSIMTETIIIGGINTGVLNKLESCSTMSDEIDVLIRSINAEYTGNNYDSLHKKFVSGVAQITYYWRLKRKITSKQRTTISNAAWNANIPFWEDK
ncbi:hypothetical protein [Lutibacter sp.]|uniref:hypothetical protein n=1 Tax=Lutibacter sp. TaxID=1925666 RepID=UPI0027346C66|nr:hypothetical protein [Lutibacter sp.]MDP3313300.1 hypothetical protein [Lutibacter sp.]